jgi:Domain of unknown function (DUF6285)
MHGRPTAEELVDAVRAFLQDLMSGPGAGSGSGLGSESGPGMGPGPGPGPGMGWGSGMGSGPARHQIRIAVHALEIVVRELALGPEQEEAHRGRLRELGFDDDAGLAEAIRSGRLADSPALRRVLREDTRDRLLVANPGWLPADPV